LRALFVKIHRKKNDPLRSRLIACTPEAWKRIRNDKKLLAKLRKDIGRNGKGEISQETVAGLFRKGLYIGFLHRPHKGLFRLRLLFGEEEAQKHKQIFEELEPPTDRNLAIYERTSGQSLNIYNLTLKQRKQLLGYLSDNDIRFENIERVDLIKGGLIALSEASNGNLIIEFGRDCKFPDRGFINWQEITY
jgi:hypothetical protein